MAAAVPGAVDAGRAAQRVHLQAGVIGHGGQTRQRADGLGLDAGILRKGGAGLLRLAGDAQLLLAFDLMALGLQNAAQFLEFAGVAGGGADQHGEGSFLKYESAGAIVAAVL